MFGNGKNVIGSLAAAGARWTGKGVARLTVIGPAFVGAVSGGDFAGSPLADSEAQAAAATAVAPASVPARGAREARGSAVLGRRGGSFGGARALLRPVRAGNGATRREMTVRRPEKEAETGHCACPRAVRVRFRGCGLARDNWSYREPTGRFRPIDR